ncbi:MAG: histidine kinase dimerization/phospho-acceptor domain-containing protein, partial [Burkholderiales bacterium]
MGTVVCCLYAPLYYWLGSPHVGLACLLAVPLFAGAPLIQRILKHPAAGLEVIHFTAYALITCVTYLQGGLASSPTLWWLVSIPVVALTAGGYRSAAIWLVTILATVCAFYWAHSAGLSLPADLGKAPLALVAINAVSLFVVILAFLVLVERARHRALENQKALNENLRDAAASLESQNAQLAVARDEALAASKAKSQFLANMSHEIRTPMNGVLGMAQLLATTSLSSDQQRFVKMLTASGEHLLTVINDILDALHLSHVTVPGPLRHEDLERFNPSEAAALVVSHRAFDASVKLEDLKVRCPLPVVVCVPIDQLVTTASLTRLGIAQANKPLRLAHLEEALREAV